MDLTDTERIEQLINGVLETGLEFWDNPNGGYEYTCPFCKETKCIGGGEDSPSIKDLKHASNCTYLIAKELSMNFTDKLQEAIEK